MSFDNVPPIIPGVDEPYVTTLYLDVSEVLMGWTELFISQAYLTGTADEYVTVTVHNTYAKAVSEALSRAAMKTRHSVAGPQHTAITASRVWEC
jgi:hypothetical protein